VVAAEAAVAAVVAVVAVALLVVPAVALLLVVPVVALLLVVPAVALLLVVPAVALLLVVPVVALLLVPAVALLLVPVVAPRESASFCETRSWRPTRARTRLESQSRPCRLCQTQRARGFTRRAWHYGGTAPSSCSHWAAAN